ncbi:MAG: hypothetical protein JJT96_11525 [Opitutales bacterium]|nr:hypothetical protein [Opitutales bacterium]
MIQRVFHRTLGAGFWVLFAALLFGCERKESELPPPPSLPTVGEIYPPLLGEMDRTIRQLEQQLAEIKPVLRNIETDIEEVKGLLNRQGIVVQLLPLEERIDYVDVAGRGFSPMAREFRKGLEDLWEMLLAMERMETQMILNHQELQNGRRVLRQQIEVSGLNARYDPHLVATYRGHLNTARNLLRSELKQNQLSR